MCNVSTQSYLSLYKSHFFVTGITMDKRIEENIRVKNQLLSIFAASHRIQVEDYETITHFGNHFQSKCLPDGLL